MMVIIYTLPDGALAEALDAHEDGAPIEDVLAIAARIAVAEELRGWESELPADVAEKLRARADTIDPDGAQ